MNIEIFGSLILERLLMLKLRSKKKSQIRGRQNLASKEGDEKLIIAITQIYREDWVIGAKRNGCIPDFTK